MPSDPKLTSLTTATLSLLLERQRLQSTHPTLHLAQIAANLRTLRSGVTALQDASDAGSAPGDDDSIAALRGQYERLRGMLGEEEAEKAGLTRCVCSPWFIWTFPFRIHAHGDAARDPCSIALPEAPSPTPPSSTPDRERKRSLEPATFQPYTDDPDPDPYEQNEDGMLLQQRQIIQGPSPPSSTQA